MERLGLVKPQLEAVVITTSEDGEIDYSKIKNIDEEGLFTVDQHYRIPIDEVQEHDGMDLQNCISFKAVKGSRYSEFYQAIRDTLEHMGCDPQKVAVCMGMPEILA